MRAHKLQKSSDNELRDLFLSVRMKKKVKSGEPILISILTDPLATKSLKFLLEKSESYTSTNLQFIKFLFDLQNQNQSKELTPDQIQRIMQDFINSKTINISTEDRETLNNLAKTNRMKLTDFIPVVKKIIDPYLDQALGITLMAGKSKDLEIALSIYDDAVMRKNTAITLLDTALNSYLSKTDNSEYFKERRTMVANALKELQSNTGYARRPLEDVLVDLLVKNISNKKTLGKTFQLAARHPKLANWTASMFKIEPSYGKLHKAILGRFPELAKRVVYEYNLQNKDNKNMPIKLELERVIKDLSSAQQESARKADDVDTHKIALTR